MGVHYDSWLVEYSTHHHIGSLPSHTGQFDQLFYSIWDNAAVKFQKLLGCGFYVLSLGVEEAGGMDQFLQGWDISLCHLFWGGKTGKKGRNHPHNLLVGGLGAQYHSDQELKVVLKVEKLDLRRVVGIQYICNLRSFCLNVHTKIKYHLYLDRVKLNLYTRLCIGMWPSG